MPPILMPFYSIARLVRHPEVVTKNTPTAPSSKSLLVCRTRRLTAGIFGQSHRLREGIGFEALSQRGCAVLIL